MSDERVGTLRRLIGSMLGFIAAAAIAGTAAHAQAAASTGVVVGTVEDSTTGRTIPDAQVFLTGNTKIGALSNAQGKFVLKNVPSGEQSITVRYIGYRSVTRMVTVGSDTARADFKLIETANILDQMVVTGTNNATAAKEVPVAMSVVSSATIDRRGATKIEDVLNSTVPGVRVMQYAPFDYYSYIMARGSTSLSGVTSMKIYVDGIPLSSNMYLQSINPASIDRVEVIRGPQASTLYGAEAQNGVVQIFTKKGYLNSLRPTIDASVAGGFVHGPFKDGLPSSGGMYGSQHEEKVAMTGGGTDLSYNIGASYMYGGPWMEAYSKKLPNFYSTFNSNLLKVNTQVSYRNGSQYVGYTQNPGVRRQLLTGQFGTPNASVGLGPGLGFLETYRNVSQRRYEDFNVGGSGLALNISHDVSNWKNALIIGRDVNVYGYTFIPYRTGTYKSITDSMYMSYNSNNYNNSLRYQTSYQFAPSKNLTASVQAGLEVGRTGALTAYGYSLKKSGPYNTTPYVVKTPSWSRGQFVQAELGIFEMFNVTFGARLEDSPGFGENISFTDRLAPRVGVAYNTGFGAVNVKVRAAYGTAFKAPTVSQKSPGSSGPTYMYFDNQTLRPEKNTGSEAGLELFFGQAASLSFTGYDQTAEDLIGIFYLSGYGKVCTATDICRYQYQNIGAIANRGLETEARYRFGKLEIMGNAAYSSSKPTHIEPGYSGPAMIGKQLIRQPKWTGGASATYTTKTLTLGWDMAYLGEREGIWYDQYYRSYYAAYAPNGSRDLYDMLVMQRSKATYNMNATYYFRAGWSIFGRVNNILDDSYPDSDDNYPTAGRAVLIGVRRTK